MEGSDNFRKEWDKSYENGDNNILYPQVEVVRFLNRFVCKRNNDKTVSILLSGGENKGLRGLDFACGVGTHSITFADFEIDGFGVDISSVAIEKAKLNAAERGLEPNRFTVLDANDQTLPFEDNFFDFIVAESCLDSMAKPVAIKYIRELKRVCSGLVYASFIGKDSSISTDEFIVATNLEKGTVQSVYDAEKIVDLFGTAKERFSYFSSYSHVDCITDQLVGKRYYCVIKSELINFS